jgi:rhodanese-related sulfurtransferase
MPITKGVRALVADANSRIETVPTDQAIGRHGDANTVFVDIRDVRELDREGMIPGAIHAPRGMIEFWVDPDSPYYREDFGDESKTYLLYCASAWRSALATDSLRAMGMTNVAHIAGGFNGWRDAGGPVGERPRKKS